MRVAIAYQDGGTISEFEYLIEEKLRRMCIRTEYYYNVIVDLE